LTTNTRLRSDDDFVIADAIHVAVPLVERLALSGP
jgi:hypothetical protein